VRVLILEGQIVNQPRVHVNNETMGIDLSSMVQVKAYKAYLLIGIVSQLLYSEQGDDEIFPLYLGCIRQ
jgi:hypothetical protein